MKVKTAINKYIVTKSQAEKESSDNDYVSKTMGAFGFLQCLACATTVVSRSTSMWNIMSIVFLTSRTEFACARFENDSDRTVQNSTCYDDCIEYKYHSSVFQDTLISTFGLICDRAWLASFTQTISMLGLAIGVVLLGWLSDSFGRRIANLLSIAIAAIFMLAAPFASNYWLFNFFRFFAGFGSGGILTLSVIYNMEMVGSKYRELAGVSGLIGDGFGIMILAVFAYQFSTWQTFLLIFGLIAFVVFVIMLFMPETPRWLVSQKRTEEAIEMMTKVAIFNRLETSHIRETVIKAIEELETGNKKGQKRTFLDLFASRKLAKITVLGFLNWILAGFCYFGINHYATMLGLDIFVIVPLIGLFQATGSIIGSQIIKYFGRKISSFCTFSIVAIVMTILIFIPDGHWGCVVTTGIAGISSIALFSVFYIQGNELYPTPLRSMGMAVICCGAKFGAMVAPFVANMQPHWISSTIFAAIPFTGAVLSLLLPETKGRNLMDVVD